MKKSFAVIGIGRMGKRHANNIYAGRAKGFTLTAVADISQEKINKFCKKHKGVKGFLDYKEMLENCKPDAVLIATPHYSHTEIANFFINAGVAVLIEKPLAVTAKDAESLISTINSNPNVPVAIMYNQRTNPIYNRIRTDILNERLGDIKRISLTITNWYRADAYYRHDSWRGTWTGEGGGILINQCVHQLDILTWIFGEAVAVEAHIATVNRNITAENDAVAIIEFKNGVFCSFVASGHELKGVNRLEIAGSKGNVCASEFSMKRTLFARAEDIHNKRTNFGYGAVIATKTKKFRYGLGLIKYLAFGQQLNIIQNFAKHLTSGEKLIAPAKEGLSALNIINGIYASSWTGKKITFPMDNEQYEKLLSERRQNEQ
ncbi:MAG: Gfo/Idh/MocA family oxidoreductase [Firmicutes bacterium]|nr:Gfo/Idh/MocA family oxidoreductase [Bacillota bacterium]